MGADRHEEGIRDVVQDMARDADAMDRQLDELGSHIDDAEKTAAQRPEADSDFVGDAAGDWDEEASGAQQGEDAVDANPDKRDADD